MPTTLTPPPPRGTKFFEPVPGESADQAKQKISQPWSGWFRNLFNALEPGKTADVVVGATTLHFVNGLFTGSTP